MVLPLTLQIISGRLLSVKQIHKCQTMNELKLPIIAAPRTSDLLARELRRQILTGGLPAGTPLPAERELVVQTGLSRGSVREALRILEAESLVTTRPGRFGGAFASKPDDESLGRSISIYVHGKGMSLLSLLQTREAVEPSLAALAAQNRTDTELQELVDATARVESASGNPAEFLRMNVEWHMAIAKASHNELLRAFMLSISNMVYQASAIDNFVTDDMCKKVMHAHRRILDAIAAQDAPTASRRMARHLAALIADTQAFPNVPLVLDF
jgi:GntR family transcriptional repressor for pyruvate dehydrogenase complex